MSNSNSRSQQWGNALAEGERSIALARELAPEHPAYALQAADFASDREQYQAAFKVLRSTLSIAPVRADIWSRLASNGYLAEGPSAATLHALDRALYFGPREYDALLVNALITLNSGDGLAVERQLRGWNGIVDAVGMPGLAAQIDRLVIEAGKERQLQVLLRQRAQQAEALEQRGQERGGAG
jgi:tetratricopeptide (TPR) repeat protein